MNPLFVGYHTPGPYAGEARLLRTTLDCLRIEHDVVEVEPQATWQQATQRKARFIQSMRAKHPSRRLVYIDVDAIAITRPEWFYSPEADRFDLAAVRFGNELLSGTVMFNPNATVDGVIEKWIALNAQYPETLPNGMPAWDQRTLDMAIKATSAKLHELPQSYAWMPGQWLTQDKYPESVPIICHTRGSFRHNPAHT